MDKPTAVLGADALLRQWYHSVDEAIDVCRRSVAMVVGLEPGRRVEGFGTAFFFSRHGWPFLVTAGHVLDRAVENMQRGRGAVLITRGRKEMIDLSGMEFFQQQEFDIAVSPLWQRSSETYSHVTFFDEDPARRNLPPDPLYAFTGFPSTRNKTYTSREIRPHQRIITFSGHVAEPSTNATPFIYFKLGRDRAHTSDLRPTQLVLPDGAHGMSGGPVFAIGGTPFQPRLFLCGIGTACLPNSKQVKALRFEIFEAWLSQHLNW